MGEPVILFIVEGESRDSRFVDEMARCFLRGRHKVAVVNVSAAQNIYMLYNKMAADDFDLDIPSFCSIISRSIFGTAVSA